MQNRRQFVRVPFYQPVGYQKHEESPLEGSVAGDISQGGLKLNVNQFLALNTIIELQIRFPGQNRVISAHAKVVWTREVPYQEDRWEIGVQLISNEPSVSAIQDYIGLRRFEV